MTNSNKMLEAVYETIIQWDEGGSKRSRRELARRLVDLYAANVQPASQEPVAFVSDVYQSRYTIEWNGRSLPIGTSLYDHSLSLAVRQELEHKAEEAECVKLSLDKACIPTADANGNVYSLWGRVCRYATPQPVKQEPVARVDAWPHLDNDRIIVNLIPWDKLPIGTKLYATPVRTKDLDRDEIEEVVSAWWKEDATQTYQDLCKAAIAADREKNK